jgi:hypothetical protein
MKKSFKCTKHSDVLKRTDLRYFPTNSKLTITSKQECGIIKSWLILVILFLYILPESSDNNSVKGQNYFCGHKIKIVNSVVARICYS